MANSAQGTTMTFAYDAWGRTTSKTLGAKTAECAYRYGARLHAATRDFFDEGNVTFEYGGDGRRRSAAAGDLTMRYRWDAGWNMINEEDGNGTLTQTYWHHPQAGGAWGMRSAECGMRNHHADRRSPKGPPSKPLRDLRSHPWRDRVTGQNGIAR